MRFSPKPILRTIGRFLRKNDTKILKVAAYGVSIAGGVLAVKGGMDANEEIRQKEAELKAEQQNPEATLPTKEKAKIIAKKVLPAGVMMIGGVVLNELVFRIINKKFIVATAIGEYTTTKSMLYNSAAEEHKDEESNRGHGRILTRDKYGNLTLDNTEFDLYIPLIDKVIEDVTINKLIAGEVLLNNELQSYGDCYLHTLVSFLSDEKIKLDNTKRYIWQESYPNWSDRGVPVGWVYFHLMYDIDHDDVILLFSKEPESIDDKLLDKFVS